jgi:hypothetical protein
MCDRPTTSAPIVLNNVLSEKFFFAKRIWRGPFFYFYFISRFISATEIGANWPGCGWCNCLENILFQCGTALLAAECMAFDLVGTMPGSVLVFFYASSVKFHQLK